MLSYSLSIDYITIPHQDTLYQINYCHFPSSVPIFVHFPHPTPHSITYSSSSADLSSVQLLSPIIPHQQIRVNFVIRYYIYWLFYRPPSRYPISDQLLSLTIIISRHPHQQTPFHFISRPHFRPYWIHLMSPPSAGYISQFHQSINQLHHTPSVSFTRASSELRDIFRFFIITNLLS